MTLKTTKEQTDDLRGLSDGDWYQGRIFDKLSRVVMNNLCHDADMARKLEKENTELRNIAGKLGEENMKLKHDGDEFVDRWMRSIEKINELDEENADLRAKLNGAYDRAAEELEKAFNEADTLNLLHGAARVRALKEQEKVG